MAEPRPQISVIMATRNAAAHLPLAIRAVLAQTMADLELIIIDDASDDDSWAVIRAAAATDPRIRAQRRPRCGGPARARNDALGLARGDWVAICDSDDSQHPRRLELMLVAARDLGADVVADDLILFSERPMVRGETILGGHAPQHARALTLKDLVLSGVDPQGISHIGYLKPLIRNQLLRDLRYDPALRIGEDHDLYLRLLLAGATMWVLPMAAYLYRRHPASVSYRNVPEDLAAQIHALDGLVAQDRREELALHAGIRRQALLRRQAQLELAREVRSGRLGRAAWRAAMCRDHWPWVLSVLRNRLELKLVAGISRLWCRPQRWRLGRDGRAGGMSLPTDSAGELDLSAAAAPIWARLCCAASRRRIDAAVSDALGRSALWMVPAVRTPGEQSCGVAAETRAGVAAGRAAGLAEGEQVARDNGGRLRRHMGRHDTHG
ncbi:MULTISPECIES: glycosyltransferase family 2 protein [unclassified Phaeobacter]|uniref:glycosyltransferase family 2 protein n=1 Tax=unclassified Phaeobacter TaxID=2621772 RepID=UPI003A8C2C09